MSEHSTPITMLERMTKDVIKSMSGSGPGGVTDNEARFLVDMYYQLQKHRIQTNNRVKALERDAVKSGNEPEPNIFLQLVLKQQELLEENLKKILKYYAETHPIGWFFDRTVGIGPVLSAGLLAYIDIRQAPVAGNIWRFAGLDPRTTWVGAEKAKKLYADAEGDTPEEKLINVANSIHQKPERLIRDASTDFDTGELVQITAARAAKAIAKKPFNGTLKTICWKIGDSFVKVSNNKGAFYGQVYRDRKAYEIANNESGKLAGEAKKKLENFNIGKSTEAYKCYSSGKLPPAHIDARARRYAVKLFLAHLHECWYRQEIGEPPAPYAISQLGHGHYIAPPQLSTDIAA